VIFYTGLHQPSDARHFDHAFISINRIRNRKSKFVVGDWIMDSGAFTEISTYGHYRHEVAAYAAQIKRWKDCGNLIAAVAQDYMCEPFILEKTGMTVDQHQRLTIERYDALIAADTGVYIMPVLQGFSPSSYVDHIRLYGNRLTFGAYVGVGSVCKRNADPSAILAVLDAIKGERPDLRLHGFGLKATALACSPIIKLLESADSMAWSFAARKSGRNPNDWREARSFTQRIAKNMNTRGVQTTMDLIAQAEKGEG
jgi:hypothetical protein